MKCIRVLNGKVEADGQFHIAGTIYPNGISKNDVNDFNVVLQLLRLLPKPIAPSNNEFAYTFAFEL